MRKDVHDAPVNATITRHDAIAEHDSVTQPKIGGPMGDESIEFYEGIGVEKKIESLTGGELPLGMLGFDSGFTASLLGLGTEAV